MIDWQEALGMALVSENPGYMKEVLAKVPREILERAIVPISEMARLSVDKGKFDEALTYYDQLLALVPENPDWYMRRAKVNLDLTRFDAALADARHAVALRPDDVSSAVLEAQCHEGKGDDTGALAAYRRAARQHPSDMALRKKIETLEAVLQKRELLDRIIEQNPPPAEALPSPPRVTFDPALRDAPAPPDSFDQSMFVGLRQHLLRYGNQQSLKSALSRIEDARWLAAWDAALSATSGGKVLFCGSELGILPLRALKHGATHAMIVEAHPLDARIAAGVIQKNRLMAWRKENPDAQTDQTAEKRSAAFAAFNRHIQILAPDAEELQSAEANWVVFPAIDHSLLGTGLVPALRRFRTLAASAASRVLPARARIFAMGVQWKYSGPFKLDPLNQFRWSIYPTTLDAAAGEWTALTEAIELGELDFSDFVERTWSVHLPVRTAGTLDAVVYWFELDLGAARLDNAPGSDSCGLKPAVQHTDPIELALDRPMALTVHVTETRLCFQTEPPQRQLRSSHLPSWYVPMMADRVRNDAYRTALEKALAARPSALTFDIGAGLGLLSMMAARAGAARVVGCEINPAVYDAAKEVLELNALADRVTLVNKDCRQLTVPDDLPARADLVLFELFDCSLLGEGVLHFLAHTREHLAAADARYIPMGGKIRAMLVEHRLDSALGDVDINLLNPYRFSRSFINVDAGAITYRPLTEPFDVFSFNFATATVAKEHKEICTTALVDGIGGAVLFWFELQIDQETWVSNSPDCPHTMHWKQALQFLPEVHVENGMPIPLDARHDGSSVAFRWREAELPHRAFSRLPRFDPHAWQQAAELESQTQQLLQHCSSDPDEFARVAQLAIAFALDPAAQGLDPTIAERFASMFFAG